MFAIARINSRSRTCGAIFLTTLMAIRPEGKDIAKVAFVLV